MRGFYWEDWTLGRSWTSAARTVGEAEISSFAGLSGDFNPLHVDAEYCKGTVFKTRIAHGPLVYSIAAGLLFQLHLYDETLIAFMGFDSLRFLGPVRAGDTIHARVEVTEQLPTSRVDRGIVKRRLEILNQEGTVVQEGVQVFLIQRRPEAGAE